MKTGINDLNVLIDDLGKEWQQMLDKYLKNSTEDFPEEIATAISDFLDKCKEDIISNNTHDLHLIEKKMDNSLLYNNMYNYIKESLSAYYLAAPLRSLAVKNETKAIKAIDYLFNQAILRFNPEILNHYEDFGFTNRDTWLEFLDMFNAFCSFIVERNLYCVAIEKCLFNNFRFSKKICKHISEIIDANFHEIKINYIIDVLKEYE